MKWDSLFNKLILEQGERLYNRNFVTIVDEEKDFFLARIKSEYDSEKYSVMVGFAAGEIINMSCNCAYARAGENCKHMAAALFEAAEYCEHDYGLKEKADLPKEVFVEPFSDDYDSSQYFNLSKITKNVLFSEEKLRLGRELADEDKLTIKSVNCYYPNYTSAPGQECRITGTSRIDGGFGFTVDCTVDRNEIISMTCGRVGCDCRYGKYFYYRRDEKPRACEHVAALLLQFEKYQQKNEVGDFTDRNGMAILDMFREQRAKGQLENDENRLIVKKVNLEPKLMLSDGQLKLSFRIGEDKLYAIKSLKDFVNRYLEKDSLELGKTSQINFATATFSEEGKRYLDFIIGEVSQEFSHKETLEKNSRRRYYVEDVKAEGMGGHFFLYGRRLDDFFDTVEDNLVLFQNKDAGERERYITFSEASLKVKLTLTEETHGGHFQGVHLSGNLPEVYRGIKHQYYFKDNTFCRVDAASNKKITPLLNIAQEGFIDFTVGKNNVPEFYYRVLPVIEKSAEVENLVSDKINDFLPSDVDFYFYMDAEGMDIFCKPVSKYESRDFNTMDVSFDEKLDDFRDKLREGEALEIVQKYFPIEDKINGQYKCEQDDDAIFKVLEEGLSELMEIGQVHCTDAFKAKNIKRSLKVSVGVSVHSEIMDLEISSEGISKEELLEVLASFKLKKKYHRLRNGDFVDITDDSLDELNSMMTAMHISPKEFVKDKMEMPLYRALYLDSMLEHCEQIYATRDKVFKSLVKEFKTVSDSDFDVPDNFKGVLRNYQEYGYKWINMLAANHFNGILADDMGLGKTLQTIAVLQNAKKDDSRPSIIISPASLIYNWQSEFERFAPEMTVLVVAGKQNERVELIKEYQSYDVVITSYDLLKRDVAEYEGKEFLFEVIDEAQYIKTHTTAAAKSVKIISAAHKLALTGTPIENRLSELWSIFDYLMPGFLYSYDVFKREIENPIVKMKEDYATKRLKRMVSPFILRRLKKDVLKDLPDKMEEPRHAKMDEEQQRLYDAQVTHMKNLLKSQDDGEFNRNKIQILAELTKIRQICCDPGLLVEGYKGGSAKRETCMELIESAIEGEHKMLVFSQFTSMLDILAKDLDERGISYYMITGATPKERRVAMVDSFNENDVPVFLISLKAGGTGLNLTGADIVIHYDPWWNVAAQNQATDRAHRIGQKKIVSVYKLIAKGSIEEKIVKMQQEKENLANEILSGETGKAITMTREELLALFE